LALALSVSAQAAVAVAAAPSYDHYVHLTPENSAIGNFPAQKRPILTVKSGDTVRIDTGGGNRWQDKDALEWIKENQITLTPAQLEAVKETDRVVKQTTHYADIATGHLLVGPIAVEGAMPGDALEIRIISVTPRIPYGTVSTRPGRGGIPDDVKEPFSQLVRLDLARNVGVFEPGIEVPLGPFMGVMGCSPPMRKVRTAAAGRRDRLAAISTAKSWSPARRCSCRCISPARCSSPATHTPGRAMAK
jgi:acetamidase/formamidase